MKQGMFTRGALMSACLFALTQVAAAEDFDAVSCETGREKSHYGGHTYCRVTVPNGDFAGAPPPVGTENGDYKHPWESSFSWWKITPRRDHRIAEHLKPWGFYGDGTPSYATGIDATPGVVLNTPGDSIFQWIDVPNHDGTQSSVSFYTLRVTYAAYKSAGPASIGMKVIVADDKEETLSEVFEDTKAGSLSVPAIFETTVTLPPGTPVTQLGVAIGKKGDASPVIIKEVALVARTDPYGPIDF
jgi:hypothetical protein